MSYHETDLQISPSAIFVVYFPSKWCIIASQSRVIFAHDASYICASAQNRPKSAYRPWHEILRMRHCHSNANQIRIHGSPQANRGTPLFQIPNHSYITFPHQPSISRDSRPFPGFLAASSRLPPDAAYQRSSSGFRFRFQFQRHQRHQQQ